MLQLRLVDLEKQLLRKVNYLETEKTMLSNATAAYRMKTESTLNALVERISELEKGGWGCRWWWWWSRWWWSRGWYMVYSR